MARQVLWDIALPFGLRSAPGVFNSLLISGSVWMDCKIQLPRTWLVALLGYDFFTLGPAGLLFVHTPLMRFSKLLSILAFHPLRAKDPATTYIIFFSASNWTRSPWQHVCLMINYSIWPNLRTYSAAQRRFLEFCYILKWIRSLHIGNGFTNPLTNWLRLEQVLYYLIIIILFIIKNLILQRLSFNTPRLLISKEPFTLYIVIYSYMEAIHNTEVIKISHIN